MPTLVVGMLETRENYGMPTTSVGMAPFTSTFRNRNYHNVQSAKLTLVALNAMCSTIAGTIRCVR
jgi:hypothetical protein